MTVEEMFRTSGDTIKKGRLRLGMTLKQFGAHLHRVAPAVYKHELTIQNVCVMEAKGVENMRKFDACMEAIGKTVNINVV